MNTLSRYQRLIIVWTLIGAVVGLMLTPTTDYSTIRAWIGMAAGAGIASALEWRLTRQADRRQH